MDRPLQSRASVFAAALDAREGEADQGQSPGLFALVKSSRNPPNERSLSLKDPKSPRPCPLARVSESICRREEVEDVSPRIRLTQGSEHPIVVWSLLELERSDATTLDATGNISPTRQFLYVGFQTI
jgi:hypothetical protein